MHKDAHDLGLRHDLKEIQQQLMRRREVISLLGGGVALLGGRSSGGSSTQQSSSQVLSSSGGSSSGSSSSSSDCTVPASETAGPYPGDGTNTSSGTSSNVLVESGVVRSDIRSSFITSSATAEGVQLDLTLTLVNANNNCVPLAGYAVYLWHCDRLGQYSLYDLPAESYLRGVQETDANGQLIFTTIVPGCYAGRYPHMHFEVFSSLASASSGRQSVLTSQFAIPEDVCAYVYGGGFGYGESLVRFNQTSMATDNIFRDNTDAQNAVMTPFFVRSTNHSGYEASTTIGIAV